MYHGIGHRKLGKKTPHRLAMFSNMATSLIKHERIQTTVPKAKELRRIVERLITKGKNGDLGSRRNVHAFLRDDESVSKLFGDIASRFKDRKGGYTRVLRVAGTRHGDGAEVAMIELVDHVFKAKTKEQSKEDRASEKKAAKAAKGVKKPRDNSKQKVGKTDKKGGGGAVKTGVSRGT